MKIFAVASLLAALAFTYARAQQNIMLAPLDSGVNALLQAGGTIHRTPGVAVDAVIRERL